MAMTGLGFLRLAGDLTAFRLAGGRILRVLLARWRTEAAEARVDASLGNTARARDHCGEVRHVRERESVQPPPHMALFAPVP
jgi:hypothetical protein